MGIMFDDKLINLCKMFIDNDNVSFDMFIKNGFTMEDINKYLECNLIQLSDVLFILKDTKIIKDYAYYQLDNNNSKDAKEAFNYLYSNYSLDYDVILEMLIDSIKEEDYYSAMEQVYNLEKLNCKYEVDLLLYLLNRIYDFDLNIEDKELLDKVKLNNIHIEEYGEIISLINQYKYQEIINILNNKKEYYAFDEVLYVIINKIKDDYKNVYNKILTNINNRNYKVAKKILSKMQSKYKLSKKDEYILNLLNLIGTDNIVSKNIDRQYYSALDAIDDNNYIASLEMENNYQKERGYKPTQSTLYLVLRVLNIEINAKKAGLDYIYLKSNPDKVFNNFLRLIRMNKVDVALNFLRDYLIYMRKEDSYEFIINNYKYHLISGNNTKDIEKLFIDIINNNYKFKLTTYLDLFYDSIINKEFKKAFVLLNIIKLSKTTLYDGLLEVYNKYINTQYVEDDFTINNLMENKENALKLTILNKIEKLKRNKGIIILDYLNELDMKYVLDMLENKKEINVLYFYENGYKRIILKYYPKLREYIDYNHLLGEAEECFRYRNYWDSLNKYKSIISNLSEPSAFIYERCGELFWKLGHISISIQYYEMAYKIYSDENRYEMDSVKYTLDKLYKLREEQIVIPNNIYSYVDDIINNNIDIDLLKQELDNNTLMYIYLLLAEHYYQVKEYTEGDMYINLVIDNNLRSNEINKLLNTIIRNKYKRRMIKRKVLSPMDSEYTSN